VPSGIKERTNMTHTPINDCRDLETPARHNYQPDPADVEFAAWLDEINANTPPAAPQPGALALRRAQFFETQGLTNWYKAHHSYVQPPLWATVRHIFAGLRVSGLTRLALRNTWRALKPYAMPYTVVLKPRKQRRARPDPHTPRVILLPLGIVVFYTGLICFAQRQPDTDKLVAAARTGGTRDTDTAAKPRTKIINNSNGSVTITFTGCRENEKQHVSCQMTDPDGDTHWVYLPGYALPAGK